jgi:hypothetical protein
MSYWKGLMIAAAIDLVWIMGSPIVAPEPLQEAGEYVAEPTWPLNPENVGVVYVDKSRSPDVDRLIALSEQLDSLMIHLQEHSEDVDAIERVADLYASHELWPGAIGPLARAIQLDPERWSLWSALDRAVERAGLAQITDAELMLRAQEFVEMVEMWGEGC